MIWTQGVLSANVALLVAASIYLASTAVSAQEEGWVTHCVALSSDATVVVHGSMHAERGDSWLIAGDPKNRLELARVRFACGPMRDASFSRAGSLLATACSDGRVRLYEPRTLRSLHEHPGHKGWVTAVALSPNGAILASTARDNLVLVRDPLTGGALREPLQMTESVSALLIVPDSNDLLIGHGDSISLVRGNGESMSVFAESLPPTEALSASSDGRWLAAVHRNGELRLWDVVSMKLLFTVKAAESRAHSSAFSPDGSQVVTSGASSPLKIWNRESGTLVSSLATERSVIAVVWPEENRIVGADHAGKVTSWKRERGDRGVIEWRRQDAAQQADAADRPAADR